MTVSSSTNSAGPYVGNGSTTVFSFAFQCQSISDVQVVTTIPGSSDLYLNNGTDFTVSLNSSQTTAPGGFVTLITAPAIGVYVTLLRNIPDTQNTSFPNQGGFYPAVIEAALDKLTLLVGQIFRQLSTTLKTSVSTISGVTLPSPGAGMFLRWNLAGTNLEAVSGTGTAPGAFLASGTGAVSRNLNAKEGDWISVKDYGALGNGVTDDSAAFQLAVNALTSNGGMILVPDATYVINTAPNVGNKSISWFFGTGVKWLGTGTGPGVGKFPTMLTNAGQQAVGLFIQSQSSTYSASPGSGIATVSFEMIQPSSYNGQSVALYVGAEGSNSSGGNVWALNPLVTALAGSTGVYQCIEVDTNCYSATALVKGISINGIGSSNPYVGLELIRSDTSLWTNGINLWNCISGINIKPNPSLTQGIVIGGVTAIGHCPVSLQQFVNGYDGLVIQRNTDTSPSGFIFRTINAANSAVLSSIDVFGNITGAAVNGIIAVMSSYIQAAQVVMTNAATTQSSGNLSIGKGTSSSATSGSATALPGLPAGYIQGYLGSTPIKIPYYNA